MDKCKTCVWWVPPSEPTHATYQKRSYDHNLKRSAFVKPEMFVTTNMVKRFGMCKQIVHGCETYTVKEEPIAPNHEVKTIYEDARTDLAYVMDASDYSASFHPSAEFGCVMHQRKKK